MRISPEETEKLTPENQAGPGYEQDLLKFVTAAEARTADRLRQDILTETVDTVELGHNRTRPVYLGMSPGCALCGNGAWSCLFINGKCNCRCFYCPTEQTRISVPTTNTLTFSRARDYVDYVERLGFAGVSISGGEPLLTPDTTLKFITAVRKKFSDRIYLWLYTNGTLVNRDLLAQLKDAGLNEIRFDIGAVGYSLEKAALAVGLIDHVTVEIPAIPEDYGLLTNKLQEMSDCGIAFLNLHQLRLTPHNHPRLIRRPYTYLPGEQVTVLESELTALKLIRHASRNNIPLPVNYCSYIYKNRFQRMAARRRCGGLIKKEHEDVTENGHIRSLHVEGPPESLEALARSLRQSGSSPGLWLLTKEKNRLFFSAELWPRFHLSGCALFVSYFDSRLVPSVTYRNPFQEIRLNRERSVFVERHRVSEDIYIPFDKLSAFETCLTDHGVSGVTSGMCETIDRVLGYETIPRGLQDYSIMD